MNQCCLVRGIVRSSRPANIPTLFTNAAVVWVMTGMEWSGSAGRFFAVVAMGLCFYLYGMWENDRVDARWDAGHYPDRPVPCGAVSTSVLRMLSLLVGLSGLLLNMVLGGAFAVGALLLIVISLYNILHKHWKGSVLLMGACRGLWVLTAGMIFSGGTESGVVPDAVLWYAGALLAFTCVLSLIAYQEAGNPGRRLVVAALLSGMCLFDAVWLLCWGSWLSAGAVVLWLGARLLQRRGVRST